jgi:hypothetical protein
MALVAKRTRIMAPMNSQRGQISIFFSASLIVFISIIAFVINVGLFVKAKINLQNATDAAAFSGAAVQARHLTKIAYLNWEMRNIYKEWMYKYYVVGSLNTPMVENQAHGGNACDSPANCMDFRLEGDVDTLAVPPRKIYDPYNIPAVCIHITGSQTNICKRYAVPGLPEFGGYSIPGTEEASRSFIDILIGEKVNDCVMRSKINMLAAATWAYNVLPTGGEDTLAGRGPAILTDRQGAWPRAIELAMRIRNLEKVMNRPAINKPVGISDVIGEFETENMMGNERIVKAFYSGFRNLGNATDNEMKQTFKLTELPPKLSGKPSPNSNGGLLIPDSALYEKQYVDLRLMMVNLATFYAALIPRSEKDKSGACDISKVALPVPGYPLGFYKHQDMLTYYAVKGEAEFTGMFNPFADESITLRAYAAAKPAGGRIGPMLFTQKSSDSVLNARTEPGKLRSVPYILALNVEGTPNIFMSGGKVGAGQYGPGVPLPINIGATPFWIKDPANPVGGVPQGEDVYFGIPNMVYDFDPGSTSLSSENYTSGTTNLFIVEPAKSDPEAGDYGGDKAIGLYNRDQFKAFRGEVGGNVTPEILVNQISRVKAATRYEAANYLIPTANDFNAANGVDSFGMMGNDPEVVEVDGKTLKRYNVNIYAPLYSTSQKDVLWTTNEEVVTTIVQFMTLQKYGLKNYIYSLNKAAIQTYQTALNNSSVAAQNAIEGFKKAAKAISDIDVTNVDTDHYRNEFPDKNCNSLASQFWHYYYGDPVFALNPIADQTGCPVTLVSLLRSYYASSAADPNYSSTHYKMEYNYYENNWKDSTPLRIYSAYMPGPYNGISPSGQFTPPFPGLDSEQMQRNFYSTKLVMLSSLTESGNYADKNQFATHSEGDFTITGTSPERKQESFANPLDVSSFSFIKH